MNASDLIAGNFLVTLIAVLAAAVGAYWYFRRKKLDKDGNP